MNQTDPTKPTHAPGNTGTELDPTKPQGQFRVRAGDLVEVADPHHPRLFLAQVVGFYRLGRTVYARLASPPTSTAPVVRVSTKVRNVKRAWRLVRRA